MAQRWLKDQKRPFRRKRQKKYHDLLRENYPLPNGVEEVKFKFGDDANGDSAVWITVVVRPDLSPTRNRFADINEFALRLKASILAAGLPR
jgi:hypothetical protein